MREKSQRQRGKRGNAINKERARDKGKAWQKKRESQGAQY